MATLGLSFIVCQMGIAAACLSLGRVLDISEIQLYNGAWSLYLEIPRFVNSFILQTMVVLGAEKLKFVCVPMGEP